MNPQEALALVQGRIHALWDAQARGAQFQAGRTVFVRTQGIPDKTGGLPFSEAEMWALVEYVDWPKRHSACIDCEGKWRAFVRLVETSASGAHQKGTSDLRKGVNHLRAFVQMVPHTPSPFESLGLSPMVVRNLTEPRNAGIVVVGGGPQSGRTATAASLFVAMARAKSSGGVSALTIESPIEYVLNDAAMTNPAQNPASVIQIEPGLDVPSWAAAVDLAIREDFDQVLLSSITPVCDGVVHHLGQAAGLIAASGKHVVTTANATSFAEIFLSLATPRRAPDAPIDIHGAVIVAHRLRAIILQEIIFARGEDHRFTRFLHTAVLYLGNDERSALLELLRATNPAGLAPTLQQFFRNNTTARATLHESLDRLGKARTFATLTL